ASVALRMNQNAVDRFDETVARYLGINRTDGRCLDILARRGPLPAGELAREARVTTGSTTAMVDRLSRQGYVRRVRDESDRRRVVVELTDECGDLLAGLFGPVAEEGTAVFEALSDAQLRFLRDFLRSGTSFVERHQARVEELPPRARRTPGRRG
ncbi:MAG: MarR family winged helix-turn-helix transcriptional regulator, partial [Actinomycetota bacterium]